jgi:two-component system, response regulator / RNA-binding antiterminator
MRWRASVSNRAKPVAETLRVLLVDEDPDRLRQLQEALLDASCEVAATARPDEDLVRCVRDVQPDVIIIDMASPRRDTLESMHVLARERPIIMFVDSSDSQATQTAIRAGVTAYIIDGLNPKRVKPILDVAIARFQEHHELRQELEKAKATLTGRKVIERAKGILMKERGLDEESAYCVLRKQAMEQNKRLVDVAQTLLTYADLLRPRK